MLDILIKNAMIFDGSGSVPYEADMAIENGIITRIEKDISDNADKVIEAKGLACCPGFVDIHSHTDSTILAQPEAHSKIHQGITTDVVGNCGFSMGPITEKNRDYFTATLENIGIVPSWKTLGEFLDVLKEKGTSVNILTLVGHGTVRAAVLGEEDVQPDEAQLEEMRREVAKAMEEGAIGLSSGLQYPPGVFAKTEEVIELSKVASEYGGFYATHMRCESAKVLDSIDETLRIGAEGNIPVQISHIKTSGKPQWGQMNLVLGKIDAARGRGQKVSYDRYPYLACQTSLDIFLPDWVHDGGRRAMLERLQNPDEREKIVNYVREYVRTESGWENILITSTTAPDAKDIHGKNLEEIAESRKQEPAYTMLDLIIEGDGLVDMCCFAMNQEDTDMVLLRGDCMICTDSSVRSPYGILSKDQPHPRSYGAFPRFIDDYVHKRNKIPMQEAIRRLTSLPAGWLKFDKRGMLMPDYYADILVFDADEIKDMATFTEPHQFAAGINHVIVNGKLTIENGKHNGTLAGKVNP